LSCSTFAVIHHIAWVYQRQLILVYDKLLGGSRDNIKWHWSPFVEELLVAWQGQGPLSGSMCPSQTASGHTKILHPSPLKLQVNHQHLPLVGFPLPSNRHHRSNGDCLEGKSKNYQVCSVQYCVQQLCTVQCTHIWTDLTVLWIVFCLTGPISLCLDSFLYSVYHCILHACVGL